jgi:Flagellar hook-length control protein FliK
MSISLISTATNPFASAEPGNVGNSKLSPNNADPVLGVAGFFTLLSSFASGAETEAVLPTDAPVAAELEQKTCPQLPDLSINPALLGLPTDLSLMLAQANGGSFDQLQSSGEVDLAAVEVPVLVQSANGGMMGHQPINFAEATAILTETQVASVPTDLATILAAGASTLTGLNVQSKPAVSLNGLSTEPPVAPPVVNHADVSVLTVQGTAPMDSAFTPGASSAGPRRAFTGKPELDKAFAPMLPFISTDTPRPTATGTATVAVVTTAQTVDLPNAPLVQDNQLKFGSGSAPKPAIQITDNFNTGVVMPAPAVIGRADEPLRAAGILNEQAAPVLNQPNSVASERHSALDARISNVCELANGLARDAGLVPVLAVSAPGDGFLRRINERMENASSSLVNASLGVLGGQQAFQAGVPADVTLTPSASPMPVESQVAQAVSHWVSQGIKHASLKLDGFGQEPLEVMISMNGSEASIDFRTDLPEVRQILEGTVLHLKELLKNEGLMLADVTVGSSGHSGAGSQDQRNEPGAQRENPVKLDNIAPPAPAKPQSSSGKVLDLFV